MKNKIEKKQEFVTKNYYSVEHMPLADVVDVSKFIGGEDMHLISYEKKTVVEGDNVTAQSPVKKQMIVIGDALQNIVEQPHLFETAIKSNPNPNPIYVVKNDCLELVAKEGLHGQLGKMVYNEDVKKFTDFISDKFFDDAGKPGYTFVQFLENKNHLRVLMDSTGKMVTEPMMFDYVGARLDNEQYDLDKVIEHLMKRDDVAFFIEANSYSSDKKKLLKCPLKGDEEGLDGIISDIPGYNAEEGRDESIYVVYYPKSEVVPQLMNWEMSEEDKKQHIFSLENFIVQNILECKPFLNVPVVNNVPEVPKRKFKR